MSWIEEADLPDLPAIFQVLSLDREALEAVRQLNETLAFDNSLSRVQEELIATVVAVANQCRYGALTHGGFLRRQSGDSSLARQLLSDYTRADLSPKDHRMLDFATRVTLEPASPTENDVKGLWAAGFEDQDIVSIVLVTCLFNFMNRLASNLGVDIPPSFQRVVEKWLTGPATQQAWLLRPWEEHPQGPLEGRPRGPLDASPGRAPGPGVKGGTHPSPSRGETPVAGSTQPPNNSTDTPMAGGTQPPPVLEDANPLKRFVKECCVVSPEESAFARDLYIAYIRWCDENHQGSLLQRIFGVGLAELGFCRRRRGHGHHWWMGIGMAGRGGL